MQLIPITLMLDTSLNSFHPNTNNFILD